MKTVFVINPMAGKGGNTEKLIKEINIASKKLSAQAECYITKAPKDATNFVAQYPGHEDIRFIACGGDGTFGEVLNGVMQRENSAAGIMPFGTGNDFCRNFENCDFSDIEGLLCGNTIKCDVIKYKSETHYGYCANMFNIGFDCNVADKTSQLKQKPFLKGSLAYFLSIFIMLVKKKGAALRIELDGEAIHEGPLLLTSIANGSFCGGGIKSNPLANVSDGLMNINIVKNISRLNFLSKLPFYMKGTHIHLKNIQSIIASYDAGKAIITPLDKDMRLCADGEIFTVGKTEFEIMKDAFDFIIPR